MRIIELLEGSNFDQSDFIEQYGDKKEINYDLIEDLIYYMNNNDNVYRYHLYPAIVKCVNALKSKTPITSDIFTKAVVQGYNNYIDEYPIRELPGKLDRKLCKKICNKIFDQTKDDISQGKYED